MLFLPRRAEEPLVLCMIMIVAISALVSGCGGPGETEGGREARTFFLITDTNELDRHYADASIGEVIRVGFNKPLDIETAGDAPWGDSRRPLRIIPDQDPRPMKIFEKETLEEVDGRLYASSGARRLIFVPEDLLAPDTAYCVLISATIRSTDGEYLGGNHRFEVKTDRLAKVVDITSDADNVLTGGEIHFSAQTTMDFGALEWDFGEGRRIDQAWDNSAAGCAFDASGIHEVTLFASDHYGRVFSAKKEVCVFPDLSSVLAGHGRFVDVAPVSVDNMPDDTLAGLIQKFSSDILAAVSSDMALTSTGGAASRSDGGRAVTMLSEMVPGKPLVSLSIAPERISSFGGDYVKSLIDASRFIGIVSFKGFPAVLSYSPLEGYAVLEMLVFEGDFRMRYNALPYDIDLSLKGMNPTPAVHRLSVPISNETLANFQANLDKNIQQPLSVLYTQIDRKTGKAFYWIDTLQKERARSYQSVRSLARWDIGGSVNLGVVEVSGSIGSGGVDVDVDVNPELQAVYDFLTADLIDLLTGTQAFINEVIEQDPFAHLPDVKSRCADIEDEFSSLYETFQNPAGLVSAVTQPELLIADLRRFLYAGQSASVKSVAAEAFNSLNQEGGAFELISDPLFAVEDMAEYLSGFLPDVNEDAHVIFQAGSEGMTINVKSGNTERTLSLDMLNTLSGYADAVCDALGENFPLAGMIDKLDSLQEIYGPGITGQARYDYRGSEQKLQFTFLVQSGETPLYRLRVEISPTYTGLDVKISDPLSPDSWILLEYEALPFSVTDDTLDQMFDMLAFAASPLPNITLTMQTEYRGIALLVSSKLRPALHFSAYVNLGMELNYYFAVGGKGEIGIQLYTAVDAGAITGDVLKEVAKSAFCASRDSFSGHFSAAGGGDVAHGVMNFVDEEEFMDFMLMFLENLKTQLLAAGVEESLLSAVSVGISPSAEVGIGLGAGGTGTGGGGANLALGTAFDVNTNLLFFKDTLLAYYDNNSIDSFFMTPLKTSLKAVDVAKRPSPFDVNGVTKVFEEGFDEIIQQPPEGTETEADRYNMINSFFNSMAQNVSFGVSFQAGIDGELEEAADLEGGFALGPCISVNGEFVFNSLYPVLHRAFETQAAPPSMIDRLRVLDQPGIFPEISFAVPLSGCLEAGFDEAAQVNLGLGAQIDYIEGKISLQGDPFRIAAEGGIPGVKMLRPYPVVVMEQQPLTVPRGEEVTFSAGSSELEAGTTITDATWFINGQKITDTGWVVENNEIIATVTDTSIDTAITFKPQVLTKFSVRCDLEDSAGRTGFEYMDFTPANQAPGQPVMTLNPGAEISRNVKIPVSAEDPDGDPVMYEVVIASDKDFGDVLYTYTVSGEKISLPPTIAEDGAYFIKTRAYDGVDYGAWSDPVQFIVTAPMVQLLEPEEGQAFVYGAQDMITLTWSCDADHSRVQLSDDPAFDSMIRDVIQDFHFHEVTGNDLQDMTPGVYYWRVAGYDGDLGDIGEAVLEWSETRTFYVRPPAPVPTGPGDEQVFGYNEEINFAVQVDSDVEQCEFAYSPSDDFSWGTTTRIGDALEWQTGPLPVGTYYWRSRTWDSGVESSWSASRSFQVVNKMPSEVYLTRYEIDSCIDGVLNLAHFWAADPEGGALSYNVHVLHIDEGGLETVVKSYNGVSPPFALDLSDGGYDFYVSIQAVDERGAAGEAWAFNEYLHVSTDNCPPPPPRCLSPADGHPVNRDTVNLVAEEVADPDGDPLDHYEFFISGNDEDRAVSSPSPVVTLEDLEGGVYTWKVRAVSTMVGGAQTGAYGEAREFFVLDNEAPETTNVSPPPGSVFAGDDGIMLVAQATDHETDIIRFFGFELADSVAFDSIIARFKDVDDSKVEIGQSLSPGIYYWRARAADDWGYGEFGEPTCFSVIQSVNRPNIDDAGNEAEFFQDAEGTATVTFTAATDTSDCLGRFTGSLEYEIRNDDEELAVPIGNFENGVSFGLPLAAGQYTWRARHVLAGLSSAWSDPLAFTVIETNERPQTANQAPSPGEIFSAEAEVVLTLAAEDPDADQIQAYDFEYDSNDMFSDPARRYGEPSDTVVVSPLDPGVYYWRGRASDHQGYGAFSDASCFTVLSALNPPDIESVGNPETYRIVQGELDITFFAATDILDCLGNPATGILHYEIAVPEGVLTGTFESGVPFTLDLEPGSYAWRAKHEFAGMTSEWSNALPFDVLAENRRPVSKNAAPGNGEIYATEDTITLTLDVTDSDEDAIVSYDFEYGTTADFDDDPQQILGSAAGSIDITPPALPESVYYWHGRGADAEGYGDWSPATCFSVIDLPNPPDITNAGNVDQFEGDGERTILTFRVVEEALTKNCINERVGILFYEISETPDFSVTVADGSFENDTPFTEWLTPGTYYWRAVHLVGEMESPPSNPLTFAVIAPQESTLFSEDFENGIEGWSQLAPASGTYTLEVVADDENHVFHYRRDGASGAETGIQQDLDGIDIRPYSEVYLEFDVKLMDHSLPNSGSWTYSNGGTGEWPADARIYFTDTAGNHYIWNHGFLSTADSYNRTNYTVVAKGTWYHYRSPNLIGQTTTETGPNNVPVTSETIKSINRIRLRGEGHDFEGAFDNVRLICSE